MNKGFLKENDTFWITNISKASVHLTDLGIIIKPQQHMNLLDAKHHYFTREQLEKSAATGSLFSRRDKVCIRKVPPYSLEDQCQKFKHQAEYPLERLPRSAVVPEQIYYEELNVDDTKFAEENSEFAEQDRVERWKK